MSNLEWAAYVAMAIAFALAFDYSMKPSIKTKGARFALIFISAIVGSAWIVTMPMMAFYSLIAGGQRGRV